MELSVNAILATIDDFMKESGSRTHRALAGLDPAPLATELVAPLEDVTRAETIAFVRELSTSARIDATRRGRVERLLATLLGLATRARLAPHDDAIASLLRQKTFMSASRTWTLDEALSDGWSLPSTEARALLATELSSVLWNEQGPFARRFDALAEAAPTLGHASSRALVEAMHRRSFDGLAPRALELLKQTDDPARDLTAFALKRVDPQLKPSLARSVDVTRALTAPWFFEVLRKEELSHAVTRTLSDLGFDPNALGRVLVDADSPGRVPGAHLICLEVPDQLRLVLTAAPGLEAYAGWLGAWGEAAFLAAASRTLPFIDRVIGDGAVAMAVRRLFESLVLDEGWLKRVVRATSAQAREVARLFAWRQVMALRREAALLAVTGEALERGAVRSLADSYVSAMERALQVQPERGRFLVDVTPTAPMLPSLEAWALEASLVHTLRERFNEDWWRNPAAGRFLTGLAARGAAEGAADVAASLGRPTLEPADAARRRIVVMGA
ncbi:MAG: hypothetical protein JNJ54_11625 [Myxococcaceae bacterium]|nr:hypothetical protein [Myxococcaceae bacterium]